MSQMDSLSNSKLSNLTRFKYFLPFSNTHVSSAYRIEYSKSETLPICPPPLQSEISMPLEKSQPLTKHSQSFPKKSQPLPKISQPPPPL